MRLAIITTHPIQYYTPIFNLLHKRKKIDLKVFYTWGEQLTEKYDPGFGRNVTWDVPLLEGYSYQWVINTAADPGSHHFKGIINPDLNQHIQAFQPDAILIFGWAYNSHLKAIRYFKNKIPVFFRGDSTLLDEQKGIKAILKYIYLKWVYHHINHAFYVGLNNKAYFKKYGFKEDALSFAPHAIDNKRFEADKHLQTRQLRQKLDVKDTDLLILFAGKFIDKKAPLLLLNAFLSLNKPNIHLLFTGNGALEAELKDKQTKKVHFMEFQNQSHMPVIYQACDLFCLPSKGPGETWGLAINEAMACGKAVLVSDKVGCAIDLVKPGYNGSIFKSGDENDLLLRLDQLTRSKGMLEDYGRNSRKIIQDWNFAKIVDAIETKLIS